MSSILRMYFRGGLVANEVGVLEGTTKNLTYASTREKNYRKKADYIYPFFRKRHFSTHRKLTPTQILIFDMFAVSFRYEPVINP